jgi:basic amino acid/polyamine antiporter, APA family
MSGKLAPTLGFWTAMSIVAGSIIGSGIFMKPATMASQLGSPELLILIWVGAGIMTLFGALSCAEVASMFPETGGLYVFFQKMYGEFWAYLYAWAGFAVFNTAGVASIAYVMATYFEYFISLPRLDLGMEKSIDLFIPFMGHIYPLENIGVKSLTVLVVWLLTLVSFRSTKLGGKVLVVFTMLKMIAIALLVLAIFFSGEGNFQNLVTGSVIIEKKGWLLVGAIMAATSGAFWAYDGWTNITFMAGEIKNPKQNIPKSLFLGTTLCILVYVLINLAYLFVLPIDQIAQSKMVASDAMQVVLGVAGGSLIALMVILSTMGATHSSILSTTRITFAMSAQGRFFKTFGEVHPKFGTPANALLLHGVWTSMLVFSGSFDALTDMLIFISWLFYGMSVFGVFILRRKWPAADRTYKVWGYPVVPAIFVLFTFCYLVMTLYTDITSYISGKTYFINSLMGIALTCLGIPLYWYFRNKSKPIPT